MASARPERVLLLLALLIGSPGVQAQSTPELILPVLQKVTVDPAAVRSQIQLYLVQKLPRLELPADRSAWEKEAQEIRARVLDEVVFRGWPRDWVLADPAWEEMGTLAGRGYTIRKLRFQIVPGFFAPVLMYIPDRLSGPAPAVLNVNGHVGPLGKSVEYKQKRCINLAKRGILALNLEWPAFGELSALENSHWFAAHLDLVGTSAVGFFYLAMRRGLDYLASHPAVDPNRLGVTGLSGGGWQTIVLSALDPRVSVAVPVAGYSSLISRIERPGDIGDIEQNAADLLLGQDYSHLTAMRAPRPTLLIYNTDDDCCFRAPLVKPHLFDAVRPFFQLMGAPQALGWYENHDPGDHNYQKDNRVQAYRFFEEHFGLPLSEGEIPVDGEIRNYGELVVGLPDSNLTILGLARILARRLFPEKSSPAAADPARLGLEQTVRFRPVSLKRVWNLDNTRKKGIETLSCRFDFDDGLSAAGVLAKAVDTPVTGATIVLRDGGKRFAAEEVSDCINRGQQVLALDLVLNGDAAPADVTGFAQLLTTIGERPLGIQAAHLLAMTEWLQHRSGRPSIGVTASGCRSQVMAQVAAALSPMSFSRLTVRRGIPSLTRLLDVPVEYEEAPELFCRDLLATFDVPVLRRMAGEDRIEFLETDTPAAGR